MNLLNAKEELKKIYIIGNYFNLIYKFKFKNHNDIVFIENKNFLNEKEIYYEINNFKFLNCDIII
mgnify:CR=1 FL=1